jgi:ABC-type uncharacterized transport system substrate-binding protein
LEPAGDPVGTGLIASLARPGGNVTGLSGTAVDVAPKTLELIREVIPSALRVAVLGHAVDPFGKLFVEYARRVRKVRGNVTGLSAATAELAGKSLELVREILPSAHRVAALADPMNPFTKPFMEQVQMAGRALGFDIRPVMVRGAEEYGAAFSAIATERMDAVIIQPTLPRKEAVDLTLKHRLPSVSGNRALADAGGLMSYSASVADRYRNAAIYVDKILKGAKPTDLPVQQPTKFELVINLKTAKMPR